MAWSLKKLLNYEFTPRVYPDSRVDPAKFPDDEFPVCCPKCGYSLRGLESGRCPECAQEFDKGRLIVEQYLLRRLPRADLWFRAARWCRITGLLLCALAIGVAITVLAAFRFGWVSAEEIPWSHDWVLMIGLLCMIAAISGYLLALGASMIPLVRAPGNRAKRRRIRAALERPGRPE